MKDQDTSIGGPDARFPATRRSAVLAAGSESPEERRRALEILVALYWKPVYKYLRLRFRQTNEDAKDHTQAFFTRAMEKGFFAGYDPARGTFRTYLRTCLDRFVANEKKAAGRLKRAGGATFVGLDFEGAEGELRDGALAGGETPETCFEREWIRSFFALAVDALRRELGAEGKEVYFTLFERYDLDPPAGERPSYRQLAEELGLKETTVTNHLAATRRRFRRLVLDRLREVTASDAELREEARSLFGGVP